MTNDILDKEESQSEDLYLSKNAILHLRGIRKRGAIISISLGTVVLFLLLAVFAILIGVLIEQGGLNPAIIESCFTLGITFVVLALPSYQLYKFSKLVKQAINHKDSSDLAMSLKWLKLFMGFTTAILLFFLGIFLIALIMNTKDLLETFA